MTDQVLRDAKGMVIGRIATAADGVQTLRDAAGLPQGTYDPQSNKTRDARGAVVGDGNLLAALVARRRRDVR